MSPAARRILLSVAAIVVVALCGGDLDFSRPRSRWRLRGARKWRWRIIAALIPRVFGGARAGEPVDARRLSGKGGGLHGLPYHAQGGKEYAGGLDSNCHSARFIRPTSRPTRRPASAITAIRIFSMSFIAASGVTGRGCILRLPFASYTYMTDADALAIKAYLFSLPPVHAAAPENTLTFPFNQRWAMSFWSAVFNPDTRFEPDASRARNGTEVLISRRRWRIAANAIRRETSRSR